MRLLLVLLLVGAVMAGAIYVFSPWGYYMGGRFHVIPKWQGVGQLHSNSAGGDYAIYVWFWPYHGRFRQLAYVNGNALVCTPRGEKFSLKLGGDFDKPPGHDLDGKKGRLYMFNRTANHIFNGGNARPELELQGHWSGSDLVMDDHGSIARNFEPDGKLYTGHSPSRPYMSEISPVTLREGGKSEFEAACAAIKK